MCGNQAAITGGRNMERQFNVGQYVVYVDPYGKIKDALVTIWWHQMASYNSSTGMPGCNVVFVSNDPKKDDSYGTQIERSTSVVHKSFQPAHGNYWCFPDEL